MLLFYSDISRVSIIPNNDSLTRRELRTTAVDHVLDNRDQYGEDVDYEALGLALYTEDLITGERHDIERSDISTYLSDSDVDEQSFVEYKAGLASDYQEFVDFMGDFLGMRDQIINDIESEGVFYQALYEEARNERNNAEEALIDIKDMVKDTRTGSDWLDSIPELDPDVDSPEDDPDTGSPDDNPDTGVSSGFSTWSNYNFGTQSIGGMSTWSNYNFGVQNVSNSSTSSNYNFGTQASDFEDVEITTGNLNEDLFEEDSENDLWGSGQNRQNLGTVPSIYNPQINFSPTININTGNESTSIEQAL